MYGEEPNIGYQGIKRVSKQEVYNAIAYQVQNSTGVCVSNIIKLDDTPSQIRHCCVGGGISILSAYTFNVPSPFGVVSVPYYFCSTCGNLYIFSNFYD